MNKSTTTSFTPNAAASEQDYDALKLSEEEYRKLLASGHPSGVSVAQASDAGTSKRLAN